MSEAHDRNGEPASPDGERAGAEPERQRETETGPATGNTTGPATGNTTGGEDRIDLDAIDEDALRDLLRDSVRDLAPSPDALEHLRRAVPARRARRRQLVVGAAAAVLACSVAVPAMLHTDFVTGDDKTMYTAGHAQDHVAEEQESTGGDAGQGPAAGVSPDGGPSGEAHRGAETGAPTTGTSAGPNPSTSLGPISPTCTREQLSGGKAVRGEADAEGHVYGSFTVVNTSEDSCTVDGDGIVLATAQGSAKSTMIQVVDHTAGDAATGLPDPVIAADDEVVLKPDAGYVVRFAWIPREGGGPSGCSTSSPTPGGGEGGEGGESPGGQQPMGSSESLEEGTDSGGTTGGDTGTESGDGADSGTGGTEGGASGGTGGGTGSTGGTDGGTGSTGGGDGGTVTPPSVVVSHTPDVGDPVAGEVVIEGACAGTLYRTGVLPAA